MSVSHWLLWLSKSSGSEYQTWLMIIDNWSEPSADRQTAPNGTTSRWCGCFKELVSCHASRKTSLPPTKPSPRFYFKTYFGWRSTWAAMESSQFSGRCRLWPSALVVSFRWCLPAAGSQLRWFQHLLDDSLWRFFWMDVESVCVFGSSHSIDIPFLTGGGIFKFRWQ